MIQQVVQWVAGALLTIMLAVVGYQQSQISRLEERQFIFQKEAVSEAKLKNMEDRLQLGFNQRIDGIRTEIALTNKYLERIVEDYTRNKK